MIKLQLSIIILSVVNCIKKMTDIESLRLLTEAVKERQVPTLHPPPPSMYN